MNKNVHKYFVLLNDSVNKYSFIWEIDSNKNMTEQINEMFREYWINNEEGDTPDFFIELINKLD